MTNRLLIQFFHWYYNDEQLLWQKATQEAKHLAELGITDVWLPPAYKATSGQNSVGYDCYDLYDLGEFDQKNTVETKYGSKDSYLDAIAALQKNGVSVVADVVFNHKAGGDELEKIAVRTVDSTNRAEFTSEVMDIDAWTKFTFPGRAGKYSDFIWDHHCFSGVDRAENLQQNAIYSIQNEYGEMWEDVPSSEMGNYDYLMFNDIETRNPAVREELKRWGEWYYNTCKMDGFRLDAVKHIAHDFLNEWIDHMKHTFKKDFFFVAENWIVDNVAELESYVALTEGRTQLFDTLLHHNLYQASLQGNEYNLSTIFQDTLVQTHPELSVTFVDNHDTQPLQALTAYVEYWFRPLGYALILLREQGIPCVFYPDLYGGKYEDKNDEGEDVTVELVPLAELPDLCAIRRDKSYGIQRDYLDHPNCIGWTREGEDDKPGSGLAVVMSNSAEGHKTMEMGMKHAGKTFVDAMGKRKEEIVVNEEGWAEFYCLGGSVSVWVLK